MNLQEITDFLTLYGLRFLMGILILVVGWFLVKYIVKIMDKTLTGHFDQILTSFILKLGKALLLILVFLTAASTVGIEVTSFVAILGAASFAVGLALQGSLSNFAGGVLLLIFKPFEAGDFIDAANVKGKVIEIQLLYTVLNTRDNKRVYIPNGSLANQTITNFTTNPTRRVELQFGIGYDDDFEEAKAIIRDIVEDHDRIQQEPEPIIRVGEHGDNSVEIYTWVWIDRESRGDYWEVYFYLHEEVKKRFDQAGIGIPYPQLDVHFDPAVEDGFVSRREQLNLNRKLAREKLEQQQAGDDEIV